MSRGGGNEAGLGQPQVKSSHRSWTQGLAAGYDFYLAWGALTGNLEQLRQLRAQLLHGNVCDGAQDHHRPLEAGCGQKTDALREAGGEGRARSTWASSPAPRGARGPGTCPALPASTHSGAALGPMSPGWLWATGDTALVPTFLQGHPLVWRVVALLCEGRQVLPALPQHLLGTPQAPQLPKLGPCPRGVGTRRGFQHRLQAGDLLGPRREKGSGPGTSGFTPRFVSPGSKGRGGIQRPCSVAQPDEAVVAFSLWDLGQPEHQLPHHP